MSIPMPPNHLPPPARLLRIFRIWLGSALVLAAAACAALAWLHHARRGTMERARGMVVAIRDARIDLAKGFLDLTLAADEHSPYRREEGLALMDQAVAAFREAGQDLWASASLPGAPDGLAEAFDARVARFRQLLEELPLAAGPARAAKEVQLRVAFHELENLAAQADGAAQRRVGRLVAGFGREFDATLLALLLLLGGLSAGVWIAARRHAAAMRALHDSERRVRAMLEAIPDLVFRLNRVGVFLDFRAAAEELYNPEMPDLVGRNYRDVLPPEFEAQAEPRIRAALDSGTMQTFEYQLRHADGRGARDYEARVVASGADEVTAIVRDITVRRHADEQRRASEERFKAVFDGSADGILLIDPATARLRYCNAEICRLLGCPAEELLALGLADLHPTSDLAMVNELFGRVARGETTRGHGIPMLRRDGTIFLADINGSLITFGGAPCVVGFIRDITERVRADAFGGIQLELAHSLSFTHELKAGLRLCLDAAIRTAGLDSGGFYLFDESEGALDLVVHQGLSQEFTRAVGRFDAASPQVRLVAEGCARYTQFSALRPGMPEAELREGLRFLAVVPMHHQDRIIGCLNVASHAVDDIPAALRRSLEIIADNACAAVARLKAEEATRASEEKYRGIFDESVAAIFVFDLDKRFRDANQAGLDLLGYPRDELLKLGMPDVDADPAAVRPAHAELLAGGRLASYEHRIRRKDGAVITVLNNSRALTDVAGKAVGFQSTLIDITERRRAEEALRRSEAQLSDALRMAQAGYWEYDIARDQFTFNDHFFRIFHTTAAEVGGYTMPAAEYARRFCHPDDAEMVAAEVRAAIASPDPHYTRRIEHRIHYAGGEPGYISVRFFVEKDAEGRTVRTYGVNQDITERRRAGQEMAQLATAVEQAAEAIVITDTHGVICYVNPAFVQVTGYGRLEAVGRTPSLLKSGRHDAGLYRDMWDTLARGAVWRGHLVDRRKDGQLFDADAVISPIVSEHGMTVNYVGALRDMTREQALEQRVGQAEKMELVGRLAGGVAHDFGNLLTVILGMNEEILGQLPADSPLRPDAEQVRLAAERAAELTRQLLAFSRRQVLHLGAVDVHDVLENLGKMLRRLIGEPIQLSVAAHARHPWVRGDVGQLEQVLMNLAVNARDAMPQGGTLSFETRNVDLDEAYCAKHAGAAPGPHLALVVRDTGHGFSEEVRQHLFEPFFTTKEAGRGTGMGLAMSFGIIRQCGGSIIAEGEEGKGAAFTIYLPCVEPDRAAPQPAAPEAAALRGRETILIAEDEPQVRQFTAHFLRRLGYRVLAAESGEAALQVARQHLGPGGLDLLLSDVIMPGMNGRDLADRIRALFPAAKVLMTSGYTAEILDRSNGAPPLPLIEKPYAAPQLARKVRELLDEP